MGGSGHLSRALVVFFTKSNAPRICPRLADSEPVTASSGSDVKVGRLFYDPCGRNGCHVKVRRAGDLPWVSPVPC